MFKTPILFLIFNRQETTQKVFEAIKNIQPKVLYIAADGPRNETENELCNKTRLITEQINWNCSVQRLYRENNLGCKNAVSSAITWFFEHEDEGIILEDDTLPDSTFFQYCSVLLEKYRYSENVLSISGTNFLMNSFKSIDSVYFSTLAPIWGWATWKRVWKRYTVSITDYSEQELREKCLLRFHGNTTITKWALDIISAVHNNKLNTWDVQLLYLAIMNDLYSIVPTKNLVKNIGQIGTHYHEIQDGDSGFFNMNTFPINTEKITYPTDVKVDYAIETISYKNIEKFYLKSKENVFTRILNKIRRSF